MSKRAAYYERCKSFYVEEGYSVRAIAKMVNKNHPDGPTRRTIQNWKDEGDWDKKRQRFVDQEEDLFKVTRDVATQAGRNAKENPTPENINSFVRILSVLKYKEQIRDINDIPDDEDSGRSKEEKMADLVSQLEEVMGA